MNTEIKHRQFCAGHFFQQPFPSAKFEPARCRWHWHPFTGNQIGLVRNETLSTRLLLEGDPAWIQTLKKRGHDAALSRISKSLLSRTD